MAAGFDMSGIRDLKTRIGRMTDPAFRVELAQVLSVAALAEVSNGFVHSRDPYGTPWKPLAWRKGQPLRDTGRMQGSVHVGRVGADGFTIRIGAGYAVYHQDGARTRRPLAGGKSRARVGSLPQRRMVPDAATGIGPIWAATFRRDANALLLRSMRRGH